MSLDDAADNGVSAMGLRGNFLFKSFKSDVFRRWVEGEFRAYLLGPHDVPSEETDSAELLIEQAVGTPQLLLDRTVVDGAIDAADPTFTDIVGTRLVHAVLIVKVADTGALVPAIYVSEASGLPLTPNGGDVIVHWSNGPSRIGRPKLQEQ